MTLNDGWRVTSVGEVAEVVSGPAFTSKDFGQPGEGTPLLRGENIEPGALRWTKTRTWPDALLPGYEHLLVQSGDLVLGMDRPVVAAGLKLAEVTGPDTPALLVQRVARIRGVRVEQAYLKYALMTPSFEHYLTQHFVGTQLPHISLKTIRDFRLAVPSVSEQQRIVELLDDHLSRLDAGLGYLAAAGARASTCVESWLALALAGHATSDLNSLLAAPLANGRSVPTAASGFGVLRLTALVDGRIDLAERKIGAWTADEARPFLVAEDDYLVSRGNGSLQRVALGGIVPEVQEPVAYPDTMIRMRPRTDLVVPEYFGAVWNSRVVRTQIEASARTTAGIYKVNQRQLEHVVLPMPSLAEQHRIASEFTGLRATVEKQRRAILAGTWRAEALRRALLAAAFSGELTASTEAEAIEEMAHV